MKAHRVVKRRDSHIFSRQSAQMEMRFSTLRAGRPLPPMKIPGPHFCWRLSRSPGYIAAGRIG
jgi:hypothetical protein